MTYMIQQIIMWNYLRMHLECSLSATTVAVITGNITFLLENRHVTLSHSGWGASLCTYVSGTQYWMINEHHLSLSLVHVWRCWSSLSQKKSLSGRISGWSFRWCVCQFRWLNKKPKQLLLMKSCTTWDVKKHCKSWDKLPTSTSAGLPPSTTGWLNWWVETSSQLVSG